MRPREIKHSVAESAGGLGQLSGGVPVAHSLKLHLPRLAANEPREHSREASCHSAASLDMLPTQAPSHDDHDGDRGQRMDRAGHLPGKSAPPYVTGQQSPFSEPFSAGKIHSANRAPPKTNPLAANSRRERSYQEAAANRTQKESQLDEYSRCVYTHRAPAAREAQRIASPQLGYTGRVNIDRKLPTWVLISCHGCHLHREGEWFAGTRTRVHVRDSPPGLEL